MIMIFVQINTQSLQLGQFESLTWLKVTLNGGVRNYLWMLRTICKKMRQPENMRLSMLV